MSFIERRTVNIYPDVKEKLAKLKKEWKLKSESDVIAKLVEVATARDEEIKKALDLINFIKNNN